MRRISNHCANRTDENETAIERCSATDQSTLSMTTVKAPTPACATRSTPEAMASLAVVRPHCSEWRVVQIMFQIIGIAMIPTNSR